MKRRVLVLISFVIALLILYLAFCEIYQPVSNRKLVLPKVATIKNIQISDRNLSKILLLEEEKEISAFITSCLAQAKSTKEESVSDQPTNVEDFLRVEIALSTEQENASVFYLYEKRSHIYLEQPYVGIWKLDHDFLDDNLTVLNKNR